MPPSPNLPLVYSCSGCSNLAQLANDLALRLDRDGLAEMSCIAGVGGDVPALVKKACSRRRIIALDGCHLHCVQNCLARHGVKAAHEVTLTEYGLKKRYGQDAPVQDFEMLYEELQFLVRTRA